MTHFMFLVSPLAALLPSFAQDAPSAVPEPNVEEAHPATLDAPALGRWRAWLDSPGGELPFGIELARDDPAPDGTVSPLRGWIINGTERISVPRVAFEGGELGLHMDHYDSRITARETAPGRLDGTWEKRRGAGEWTRMDFHATAGDEPRFPFEGDFGLPGLTHEELIELGYEGVVEVGEEQRWQVQFSSSEDPAVLELRRERPGLLMGTFLTTTGDYRYLAGRLGVDGLHLSCFDGAHAFLFRARVEWPGMRGEFWSRDTWHETWTAEWAPHARLPNAYHQTRWQEGASLTDLAFPDLDGELRSLGDPLLGGPARIVQIFGSWCPNCHDEAPLLVELHERYAAQGLSIVGLAFELTGEYERDLEQIRRYRDRYQIPFPLLLAGTADKERATSVLGVLDRVRSYPTTLFLRADGSVAAIHTGFTGPGTGDEHEAVRREFMDTIERLLREPRPDDTPYWKWLETSPLLLRDPFGGASYTFRRKGKKRFVDRVVHTKDGASEPETLTVELGYEAVRFGDELWKIDRNARVLVDPLDYGRRLSPNPKSFTPSLAKRDIPMEDAPLAALLDEKSLFQRREALFALAQLRAAKRQIGLPEVLGWFDEDTDLQLQVAAAWAVGMTLEREAVDDLIALLDHPWAPLRREAARSLARMSAHVEGLRERLLERPADYDPLVRKAIAAATR